MNNTAYMKYNTLFIRIFTLNLNTIDNDSFGIVINRIKDTIVTHSNTITFFMGKFLAIVSSWTIGKRESCLINLVSLWKRNIYCFLFCFSSNNYFVVPGFSHFVLNSSYGVKSLVSSSAFNRSLVSSRSSTSSIRLWYSFKSIKTAVFCPFSSTMYRGLILFKFPSIVTPPMLITLMRYGLKVKDITRTVVKHSNRNSDY